MKSVIKNEPKCGAEKMRYLLYDVNPPEGFNLRRDVYMRYAVLAHKLESSKSANLHNFKLVLPPWSQLMHWEYNSVPEQLPWSTFFDIESLKRFAPVVEMHEFFKMLDVPKYSKTVIDEVYVLQHFKDMFENGNFDERMQIESCQQEFHRPTYFYYTNLTSNNVKCLSFHGPTTNLADLLERSTAKILLIDHAEVALHDYFGSRIYWEARRSMRFNSRLREFAGNFRKNHLNSTDEHDKTFLPENWQDERAHRTAIGGPYLAVHLRRNDFVRGRANELPTLTNVAQQIERKLAELDLNTVFIASDAPSAEIQELSDKIDAKYKVVRFRPTEAEKRRFRDGGLAIIDQIICSYSRFFIGTHDSTFSFRIQEEREILGFPIDTTFNCLCKNDNNCEKPSIWTIVY